MASFVYGVDNPIYPVPCNSFQVYPFKRFMRETWAFSEHDLGNPLFWRDLLAEFLLCLIILVYLGLALITNNPAFYSVSAGVAHRGRRQGVAGVALATSIHLFDV